MGSKSEDAIVWGPEIAINGVKPKWLGDDELVRVRTSRNSLSWYDGLGVCVGPHHTAIRLPADHWAYPVIAAGMEPWAGGDAAPEDCDGTKEVMLRNGQRIFYPNVWRWSHVFSESDIIGYHKKAETAPVADPDPDTVTIKRMTEAEARKLWSSSLGGGTFVYHLWKLGLIREETLAERFARETGHEVTPAVKAALKWERGE